MRFNTGDLGGMKKYTNRDRDDNTFLGYYNQKFGGFVLATGMLVGALIQCRNIGLELFKGLRRNK